MTYDADLGEAYPAANQIFDANDPITNIEKVTFDSTSENMDERTKQVVLALSNPDPEIEPDDALAAGAAFAADGKSVNNALAFPGLFRGALDARARRFNDAMKLAAAKTIAEHAPDGDLVPDILQPEVHRAVAAAVHEAALKTGAVRFASGAEG